MTTLKQLTGPVRHLVGNRCLSRPVLAIGTTKSAFNTTAAAEYVIDGIIRNKAAMTSEALVALKASTHLPAALADWRQPSGADGSFYVQPANKTVYYVLCLNAAGTAVVVQGTYDGQPLQGGYAEGDGSVPMIPDGVAPFGLIKVVTGATTFTVGTTLFDAANVTTTFYDIASLPASNP